MDTTSYAPTRRPGVVSFIGVILYLQGFLALASAISLLIWRDQIVDYLQEQGAPAGDGSITGSVIGEAISAIVLFAVGAGIMRGSKGYRLFTAIVIGLRMALAAYVLVAHHVGGYVYSSVFTLFVGVFVLWALYAHEESDRYFETTG